MVAVMWQISVVIKTSFYIQPVEAGGKLSLKLFSDSALTATILLCWLQAWILEPECLGLNPASTPVLGGVSWKTVSDYAGSLLGLVLRGKTCEGVR